MIVSVRPRRATSTLPFAPPTDRPCRAKTPGQGFERADAIPDETVMKTYYENACWELANARNFQAQCADMNVVAAIPVVGYTLDTLRPP